MEDFNKEENFEAQSPVENHVNEVVAEESKCNILKYQQTENNSCEAKNKNCRCGAVMSICGLILGVVAIVLFVLQFMGVISPKTETPEPTVFDTTEPAETIQDIAYINLDTLLLTYNYAIKLQEDLAMEQSRAEATIQNRMKKFQDMYNAYMEKARTGMFLSAQSQQAQQSELEREEIAIRELEASLSNKLLEKQSQMNQEVYDSVVNFVNTYSAGRFKIILGNMGGVNVVYAQDGMDITNDVVAKLNQRYGGILEAETK